MPLPRAVSLLCGAVVASIVASVGYTREHSAPTLPQDERLNVPENAVLVWPIPGITRVEVGVLTPISCPAATPPRPLTSEGTIGNQGGTVEVREGGRVFATLAVDRGVVPPNLTARFSLTAERTAEGYLLFRAERAGGGPPLPQLARPRNFRLSIPYGGCENSVSPRPVWLVRMAEPLQRSIGDAIPVAENDTMGRVLHFDLDGLSPFIVSN
jgi:hypothetical protein